MAALAKLLPDITAVQGKRGQVEISTLAGKTVFFYFSASWCPPCRGFTPVLTEFYNRHHEAKNFEIILVSWDEEEEEHDGYYAKMPWLCLPFSKVDIQRHLTEGFKVQSIPTLIGINADSGEIVTMNARAEIPKDPEGKNYPWPQ